MNSNQKTSAFAGLLIVILGGFMLSGTVMAGPVERLEIVDRAIAYHGGELYRYSETELDICSRSGCFHVRSKVMGDLYEYEVSGRAGDHQRRVRITNETIDFWLDGERQSVAERDRQTLRDWVMARVYFGFLPYRLNDPNVFKEDLGLVDWRGRKLHKVKVTFAKGSSTDAQDEYLYWFDPDTGRIEQFAYSFISGRPGLRFRKLLNYRRMGGILFFDQQNFAASGNLAVELVRPEYVEKSMSLLSKVTFENIEVRPLK